MRRSRWIVLLVVAALAPAGARAEQGPRRAKADAARGETKKPNPCASQGPGFAMLPGTATCVRIGGAVEGDLSVGRGSAPNLGVK
jgi:hypothetical protein